MKIVNIMGGLGNQMFEYAFAISLQERFHEDVLIDTSHYGHLFFKRYKGANLHNGFEIHNVFPNASLKEANPLQLMRVTWYMPNYLLSRILRRLLPIRKNEIIQTSADYFSHHEEYYQIKGDAYYEGIWESAKNYIPIREKLQQVYAHGDPNEENARYIESMEAENSVGIHIRRGDYLFCPEFMGICDLNYYECAITEIQKYGQNYTYYIFSNDTRWCAEYIIPLCKNSKVVLVSNNTGKDSVWDMFLMTHCKNLIIANSSFSWWGAFLNKRGGTIIAPQKWVNRDAEYDIWLDNWIRL
ncbi:MAG TPA: alpha-1,2-fucosyltransferase [Rikenellaceae bacterium]|nr:alpha-1,2-fucosyltransferase [Rikenellaceae bacterium]